MELTSVLYGSETDAECPQVCSAYITGVSGNLRSGSLQLPEERIQRRHPQHHLAAEKAVQPVDPLRHAPVRRGIVRQDAAHKHRHEIQRPAEFLQAGQIPRNPLQRDFRFLPVRGFRVGGKEPAALNIPPDIVLQHEGRGAPGAQPQHMAPVIMLAAENKHAFPRRPCPAEERRIPVQGIHPMMGMQGTVEIPHARIRQQVRKRGGIAVHIRRHGAADCQPVFPGPVFSPFQVFPEHGFIDQVGQVQVRRAQPDAPFPDKADQILPVLWARRFQELFHLPVVLALPAEALLFLRLSGVNPAQDIHRAEQEARVLAGRQFLPDRIPDIRMGMVQHVNLPRSP